MSYRSWEGGHVLLQELIEHSYISDKAADIRSVIRWRVIQHGINLDVALVLYQIFGQAKDRWLRQGLAHASGLINNEPPEYSEHTPV